MLTINLKALKIMLRREEIIINSVRLARSGRAGQGGRIWEGCAEEVFFDPIGSYSGKLTCRGRQEEEGAARVTGLRAPEPSARTRDLEFAPAPQSHGRRPWGTEGPGHRASGTEPQPVPRSACAEAHFWMRGAHGEGPQAFTTTWAPTARLRASLWGPRDARGRQGARR